MSAVREGRSSGAVESGEPTDGDLARRAQAGDREAFGLLARRYLRPIHAVAAAFLDDPDEVADVAQETFLRALDHIRTFDVRRPFAPWLYQIARNVARNRRRRARRRRTEPLADVEGSIASDSPAPSAGVEREEIRDLLGRAIEALPEQQRTAFRLSDVEGYRATEIAGLMGLSAGTVRSHVHHARRALRARLAPLLEERSEND